MATKTQIRNKALRELGVLRLSQDPQDQDKVELEAAYDEVYAELKEEGLATWAATGEVPSKIVPYVVAWVAITRSGTYGILPGQALAAKWQSVK